MKAQRYMVHGNTNNTRISVPNCRWWKSKRVGEKQEGWWHFSKVVKAKFFSGSCFSPFIYCTPPYNPPLPHFFLNLYHPLKKIDYLMIILLQINNLRVDYSGENESTLSLPLKNWERLLLKGWVCVCVFVFFLCQIHKKEEPNKMHRQLPKSGITANATTKLLHNVWY